MKKLIQLLLLLFMLMAADPSYAMDDGGGGDAGGAGGGGGGGGGGGVDVGSMGSGTYVYDWVPESIIVLRSDLTSAVNDLKSRGIGYHSTKAVPDDIESVQLIWLTRVFVEFIPDGSGDSDEASENTREDSEESLKREQEKKAAEFEAEQAKRIKEAERNRPTPPEGPALETEKEDEQSLVKVSPEAVISDEEQKKILDSLSPEDRKIADAISGANPGGSPLSKERYNEILANVPEEYRAGTRAMADNDPSMRFDEKRMLNFVQGINTIDNQQATRAGDKAQMIETTLEYVDDAGQKTQTVMSFIPGIGWGWSAVLDGARGGANAYRDGKTGKEIVGDIITNAGTSYVTNRINGGDAFTNAKSASAEFGKIFSGQKEAVIAYGRQLTGFAAGKAVSNGLQNNAKGPTYQHEPAPKETLPTADIQNPFITTYSGQKVMK